MKSIQEKILSAKSASSLKFNPDSDGGHIDVLTAAGMAGQTSDAKLGGVLISCMERRSRQDLSAAYQGLHLRLRTHMLAKRIKGDAEAVVNQAIAWWLDRTCKVCLGQKYELNEGTPTLSSRHCKACKGAGERPFKSINPELASWTLSLMERLVSGYGSQVKEKLK